MTLNLFSVLSVLIFNNIINKNVIKKLIGLKCVKEKVKLAPVLKTFPVAAQVAFHLHTQEHMQTFRDESSQAGILSSVVLISVNVQHL